FGAGGRMADQGGTRLGIKSSTDKVMPVTVLTFERHKQIALFERARVDRKPMHGKRCIGLAQCGAFGFRGGPQRHAARPPWAMAAFTASSRSEKGITWPPIYWPVSWPLPAITRTSPDTKDSM